MKVPHRKSTTQNTPSLNPTPDPTQTTDDESKSTASRWGPTAFKMFEAAATTFASIAILGLVGYSYTIYYKDHVLKKMGNAFEPGDPILELAALGKNTPSAHKRGQIHWIERDEQAKIDRIVDGTEAGRYYLLVGEKGTGKASMIIEAMQKIDGDGVSMFDCHADMEIFRIRLGKALDFEYHEDNIGALFSIRGPRDASALLDIERAFNKLEKVALKRRAKVGKPIVLILNNMHLLRDDADGQNLLELIQQRAEQWAAGNLCTVVLNSDEYWVWLACSFAPYPTKSNNLLDLGTSQDPRYPPRSRPCQGPHESQGDRRPRKLPARLLRYCARPCSPRASLRRRRRASYLPEQSR